MFTRWTLILSAVTQYATECIARSILDLSHPSSISALCGLIGRHSTLQKHLQEVMRHHDHLHGEELIDGTVCSELQARRKNVTRRALKWRRYNSLQTPSASETSTRVYPRVIPKMKVITIIITHDDHPDEEQICGSTTGVSRAAYLLTCLNTRPSMPLPRRV